jgi:hypothetical protein
MFTSVDRAERVAASLLLIFSVAPSERELRRQLADLLRDEIFDNAREVAAERTIGEG